MDSVKATQEQFKILKDDIIGIFRNQGQFEMVLKVRNEETLDTISISHYGAISQNYGVPKKFGKLILFPDDMNMNQMLEHPFVWDAFMKQFN